MRSRKRAAINPSSGSRARQTEWQARGPCNCKFLQLPRATLMNIMSRLPVTTLLDCRCVCKRLLRLISDPEFAKIHLARSSLGILIKTLPPKKESKRLQFAQVKANGARLDVTKMNFSTKDSIPICEFVHMNACNGLICLIRAGKDDPIYVCNPILGEYLTVSPASKGRHRASFWGLGYSPASNQYKVLQTYHPLNESLYQYIEAEICTIGSGTGAWRRIGYAPKDLVSLPFNSFLNGALHWSCRTPNGSEFIHSFDFESERFLAVPPPPHFLEEDKKFTDFLRIGVLEGCLFAIFFENSVRFDIWVMKEYGVKESWTKQFVIENLYPKQSSWDFYEPLTVLNNGEVLLLYNSDVVVCFNPKRKNLRATKFFRTRSQFDATSYTPSFISLYTIARGEQVSRMRGGTREYDKPSTEEFQSCAGCGASLINCEYGFPALEQSFPEASDGRIMCTACATQAVTPEKSFLSLYGGYKFFS